MNRTINTDIIIYDNILLYTLWVSSLPSMWPSCNSTQIQHNNLEPATIVRLVRTDIKFKVKNETESYWKLLKYIESVSISRLFQ